MLKPCLGCGCPSRTSRCPACTPRKAPTAARGYGAEHQAIRRALLAAAYGTACPHCGEPMLRGEALDLDHDDDRRGYRGMAHASCNRRAGAYAGAARRRADAASLEQGTGP